MWVARDKSGHLCLYLTDERPFRSNDLCVFEWCGNHRCDEISDDLFTELKWEDEPLEVTLTEVCDVRCEHCKRGVTYDSDDVKDDETYGEWGADIIICPYCGNKICINEWG